MRISSSGDTDVGCVRTENEDSLLIDEELSLFVVADGMGGHKAGEVASGMAIQIILRELTARLDRIRSTLESGTVEGRNSARSEVGQTLAVASKEVNARARTDDALAGMGTTVALLLVIGGEAIVAHAGDSRVYLLRDGQCSQLTEDHTMLQDHLRYGLITPEEARIATYGNVLSRSVGVHPSVKADTLTIELMPGDEFILCSDGLHNYLEEGELPDLVNGLDMAAVVGRLIDLARDRGGRDNITVIDVRVLSRRLRDTSARASVTDPHDV